MFSSPHGDLLTIYELSSPRESEGSFHFGNYRGEAEDLRAVIQHFSGTSRVMSAIIGHSKGMPCLLSIQCYQFLITMHFGLEKLCSYVLGQNDACCPQLSDALEINLKS